MDFVCLSCYSLFLSYFNMGNNHAFSSHNAFGDVNRKYNVAMDSVNQLLAAAVCNMMFRNYHCDTEDDSQVVLQPLSGFMEVYW